MGTAYLEHHPATAMLALLVTVVGSMCVLAAPRLARASVRLYAWSAGLFFLTTRAGLLIIAFAVIGHPLGLDKDYWALHATSVLDTGLPYGPCPSQCGPFFPYLLAPAFLVFAPYVASIVVFIAFDLMAFLLLHHVSVDRGTGRTASALYLLSPLSWMMVVRYGQDESIGAFFVVLLLLLARRRGETLVSVAAGLGAAFTKVLFLLPALPVLLVRPKRLRALLIAATVLVGCYVPFVFLGRDVFQWMPRAGLIRGPNIWVPLDQARMADWGLIRGVFVGGMVLLLILVAVRARRMGSVNAALLLYAGLMILSPKAHTPYALLVLPLLCIRVARSEKWTELVLFALYGFLMNAYILFSPQLEAAAFGTRWILVYGTWLLILAYHAFLLATSARARAVPE